MVSRGEPQRLTELLMAISLATGLGTGQPWGHALRTCYLSVSLAAELGCSAEEIRTVQQVSLLRFLGCTADSSELADLAGGDDRAFNAAMDLPLMGSRQEMLMGFVHSLGADRSRRERARLLAKALASLAGPAQYLASHCEVAAMLGQRLGLDNDVIEALRHGFERWDGKGYPAKLRGNAIPLSVRIAVVANDADLLVRRGESPAFLLASRAGHAYDPTVVQAFMQHGVEYLSAYDSSDGWDAVLDCEPEPVTTIPDAKLDRVLAVVADFADLKSPWTRGHSPAVADLAEKAAAELGLDIEDQRHLRRAGLLHDVGRVGVENGIWDKPGKLTAEEWERVRMHPYLTQRVLDRCTALAPLAEAATSHHERLDGSGYHRACVAEQLSMPARIVAAADVFAAVRADRPYRPAMSDSRGADLLEREARAGRLDADAVAAVLSVAGMKQPEPRRSLPAGLTDREVEVLQLIARGRTNRQVAEQLYISPKTVGRHVENIYLKIEVSTRAGAAVFAMEHRLLD